MVVDQQTKFCPRCRETLPASDFSKNAAHHSGLQAYCRKCFSNYTKEIYREKPDLLEKKRKYNREHYKEYYARNRDKILALRKKRRREEKEKKDEQQ